MNQDQQRLRPPAGSMDVTSSGLGMEFIGAETFVGADLRRRIAIHESSHTTVALVYSLPIIRVTIDGAMPHLLRDSFRLPSGLALEALCILCLAGPVGEELFCGSITDGSDQGDLEQARGYLRRAGCNEVMVGAGLAQARNAARGLMTTPFARRKIPLLAAALLRHGTLSGEQINELF